LKISQKVVLRDRMPFSASEKGFFALSLRGVKRRGNLFDARDTGRVHLAGSNGNSGPGAADNGFKQTSRQHTHPHAVTI